MWLLSTARAELHLFSSPEQVKDGYAIFSHVWDEEEQSFQDLLRIQKKCAKNFTKKGRNPRNFVCEKIRRCCELAESHGYKWVWIDTCCIDKTSSAELSEAINSMFRYYGLARICYGYLRDVPSSSDVLGADARAFVRSNWFGRGWTLQELIAPRFFLFLSQSWQVLGTKSDFANLLECEFGIPATVLRFQASHTEFSIAERMSWFGERKTTRLEDEAYCLLGLFDIRMPPLYGEGSHAFQRLQEEIMKQSADTTLFAWEDIYLDDEIHSCLFAPSPSAFKPKGITYTPLRPTQQKENTENKDVSTESGGRGAEDMTFSVTPHGILAYIPIITSKNKVFGDLYWSVGNRDCQLLLCLEEDPASQGRSSRRPSYIVCCDRLLQINPFILAADASCVINAQPAPAVWREVLIRHRPPPRRLPGELPDTRTSFIPPIPMQLVLDAPFRFDEARIQQFMQESGLELDEVRNVEVPWRIGLDAWTMYVFADPLKTVKLVIKIGQCIESTSWGSHVAPIWAVVESCTASEFAYADHPWHGRLNDHVWTWPGFRKTFSFSFHNYWSEMVTAGVTLSFASCPINPKRTLVLTASYREVERYRPRPSSPSSHVARRL